MSYNIFNYLYFNPGDYMVNSCVGKVGCVPCMDRYVSCAGKPDGNSSYPGQVSHVVQSIGHIYNY